MYLLSKVQNVRYILVVLILWMLSMGAATAQVGIGTNSPHSSAQLEVRADSKGVLIPRMSASQRNGISSPADGLLVYQTDNTPGFYFYKNGTWERLITSNDSGGGQGGPGGGNTILNGTSDPWNGDGKDGDFYINISTSRLFGPKRGGVWPSKGILLGVTPQDISSNGTLTIQNGTAAVLNSLTIDIADNAVTSNKIADGSIGNNDLDKSAIPLSGFGVPTKNLSMGDVRITNLADPVRNQDAATKKYVDDRLATGGGGTTGGGAILSLDNAMNLSIKGGNAVSLADLYQSLSLSGTILSISGPRNSHVDLLGLLPKGGGGVVATDGTMSGTGLPGSPLSVADNSITGAKVADGAITSTKISNDAIATSHILDNSITETKLADGAVSSSKIADQAITGSKISDGAIAPRTLNITGPAGAAGQVLKLGPTGEFTWGNPGVTSVTTYNGLFSTNNLSGGVDLGILANGIALDRLAASGTPSSSTFLRGDGTWATVPSGGGGGSSGLTSVSHDATLSGSGTSGSALGIADAGITPQKLASGSGLVLGNGSTGQILSSTGNGYFQWVNAPAAAAVTSVGGKTGAVVLAKEDVGLSNVDNTADADKSVASAGKLTSAVTINGVSFDGSSNITIPGTLPASTIADNGKVLTVVGGTASWAAAPSGGGGSGLPGYGASQANQTLAVNSTGDGLTWVNGATFPAFAGAYRSLRTNSANTGVEWGLAVPDLPGGGVSQANRVLAINSSGNGLNWGLSIPDLPAGGALHANKVLSINSTGTALQWSTATGSLPAIGNQTVLGNRNTSGPDAAPTALTAGDLKAILGPTGTPGSTNYLRGDGQWVALPAVTPSLNGTGGTDGLMPATDKEKLNIIPALPNAAPLTQHANKVLTINSTGSALTWSVPGNGVPAYVAGDANKTLAVNGAGNGLSWVNGATFPAYSGALKSLRTNSANNGVEWGVAVPDLPAGGSSQANKVLSIDGAGTGLQWTAVPNSLPSYAAADANKTLAVNGTGNGLTWVNGATFPAYAGSHRSLRTNSTNNGVEWGVAVPDLPAGGATQANKVLTINSLGTGLAWSAPGSGAVSLASGSMLVGDGTSGNGLDMKPIQKNRVLGYAGNAAAAATAKPGELDGAALQSIIGTVAPSINGAGGANGVMVAADKEKLDKIPALPTTTPLTQHANKVLSIDGSGSGLTWAAPAGGSLPSQSGHAGKVLTTDGSSASWQPAAAGGMLVYKTSSALVRATGPGVTYSRTGAVATITIPAGVFLDYIRINESYNQRTLDLRIVDNNTFGTGNINDDADSFMPPTITLIDRGLASLADPPDDTYRYFYRTPNTAGGVISEITAYGSKTLTIQLTNMDQSDTWSIILNF